jgi:FO synthase
VSPLTPDFINPEAPWPAVQALRQKSAEAGFILKARLPVYPKFIAQGEKFLPPEVMPYVERLCDADGWVRNGGLLDFAEKHRSPFDNAQGLP